MDPLPWPSLLTVLVSLCLCFAHLFYLFVVVPVSVLRATPTCLTRSLQRAQDGSISNLNMHRFLEAQGMLT